MYDPYDPTSLDILGNIKLDIERNKDKKEVIIMVLANMRNRSKIQHQSPNKELVDPESILTRANNWCAREKIKHYVVNAIERPSLYSPFIDVAMKLHPPQTKTTFPQLINRQLTQKTNKTEQ